MRFRDTIAGSVHLRRRRAKRVGGRKGFCQRRLGPFGIDRERVKIPNWAKIQTIDTNSCRKSRLVVLSRARESLAGRGGEVGDELSEKAARRVR